MGALAPLDDVTPSIAGSYAKQWLVCVEAHPAIVLEQEYSPLKYGNVESRGLWQTQGSCSILLRTAMQFIQTQFECLPLSYAYAEIQHNFPLAQR